MDAAILAGTGQLVTGPIYLIIREHEVLKNVLSFTDPWIAMLHDIIQIFVTVNTKDGQQRPLSIILVGVEGSELDANCLGQSGRRFQG